jgi:hypothetical protein
VAPTARRDVVVGRHAGLHDEAQPLGELLQEAGAPPPLGRGRVGRAGFAERRQVPLAAAPLHPSLGERARHTAFGAGGHRGHFQGPRLHRRVVRILAGQRLALPQQGGPTMLLEPGRLLVRRVEVGAQRPANAGPSAAATISLFRPPRPKYWAVGVLQVQA